MKKVIALRGAANVGKSNAIKKVYELLLAKYPSAKVEDGDKTYRVDIKVVLTINGVKIGIENQGDPGSRLPESLQEFVKKGCRVIVCATRTRGQTVSAVSQLAPSYEVLWINQFVVPKSSEQESSNQRMAKQIVAEVETVIHA